MLINQKKSKTMIFNFTQKYQFTTRLQLNYACLEVIPKTILFGVIIQDDLKWDDNTASLVKREMQEWCSYASCQSLGLLEKI